MPSLLGLHEARPEERSRPTEGYAGHKPVSVKGVAEFVVADPENAGAVPVRMLSLSEAGALRRPRLLWLGPGAVPPVQRPPQVLRQLAGHL